MATTFLRKNLLILANRQFGLCLSRRLSITPSSTTLYAPAMLRRPSPRQLPSSMPSSIPTTLPAPVSSSSLISILDQCSLFNDLLYYDCPSISNTTIIQCAWSSTNYRYKRQRRVRNHPSRLVNTRKFRARRMRLHHKKKWLKKHKYALLKRLREKIKRRGKLFEMENVIIASKAQQFNAEHYVKRELEKAKFYGYRVSPLYDQIRDQIQRLKFE